MGDEAECAACLVLEAAQETETAIVAAGWGVAGPEDAGGAALQALAGRESVDGILVDGEPRDLATLTRWIAPGARLGLVDAAAFWGTSEASRSCVLAALAVAHLEAGNAGSILVVAARGASSVALRLERNR
jgi:regulator of RNase E activity RraA